MGHEMAWGNSFLNPSPCTVQGRVVRANFMTSRFALCPEVSTEGSPFPMFLKTPELELQVCTRKNQEDGCYLSTGLLYFDEVRELKQEHVLLRASCFLLHPCDPFAYFQVHIHRSRITRCQEACKGISNTALTWVDAWSFAWRRRLVQELRVVGNGGQEITFHICQRWCHTISRGLNIMKHDLLTLSRLGCNRLAGCGPHEYEN